MRKLIAGFEQILATAAKIFKRLTYMPGRPSSSNKAKTSAMTPPILIQDTPILYCSLFVLANKFVYGALSQFGELCSVQISVPTVYLYLLYGRYQENLPGRSAG